MFAAAPSSKISRRSQKQRPQVALQQSAIIQCFPSLQRHRCSIWKRKSSRRGRIVFTLTARFGVAWQMIIRLSSLHWLIMVFVDSKVFLILKSRVLNSHIWPGKACRRHWMCSKRRIVFSQLNRSWRKMNHWMHPTMLKWRITVQYWMSCRHNTSAMEFRWFSIWWKTIRWEFICQICRALKYFHSSENIRIRWQRKCRKFLMKPLTTSYRWTVKTSAEVKLNTNVFHPSVRWRINVFSGTRWKIMNSSMSAVVICQSRWSQSVFLAVKIVAISSKPRTASHRFSLACRYSGPTVKSTRWLYSMWTDSWVTIRQNYADSTRTRVKFKLATMLISAFGILMKSSRLNRTRLNLRTKFHHISDKSWGDESMQHVFVAGSFMMPTTRRQSTMRWEMWCWESQFADLNVLWYWTMRTTTKEMMWLY